jgi:hypothetical protein
MSRLVTVTVWSLFNLLALADLAAAQEPPPLEPPSLEPPRSGASPAPTPDGSLKLADPKPAGTKPLDPKSTASAQPNPLRPTTPKPEFRPMLAIPGVTAPAARPSAAYRSPFSRPIQPGNPPLSPSPDALPLPSELPPARSPSGSDGFPLADTPSSSALDALPPRFDRTRTRRPAGAGGMVQPGAPTVSSPVDSIPLTIEPLDEEPSTRRELTREPTTPRSTNGRAPGSTNSAANKLDDEPIRRQPAPRRGTGVLGRLFGPQPPPLPPEREESRTDPRPKRESNPDSGLDPDVAARRRIERQIRATLGDKVRSVEISVTGRNVTIVAQPSRLWLRRSVRRSLETLPALQGYRARIEVSE